MLIEIEIPDEYGPLLKNKRLIVRDIALRHNSRNSIDFNLDVMTASLHATASSAMRGEEAEKIFQAISDAISESRKQAPCFSQNNTVKEPIKVNMNPNVALVLDKIHTCKKTQKTNF